jgi:autotransporter-associated beta strand protein
MTASDAAGTSGFNYPWGWSDGHFPQAGTTYSTGNYLLRTPAGSPSWTFAGDSLTVNNTNGANGGLQFNGNGTASVVTFKNLILDGGYVRQASTASDLFQLAGKVTLSQSPTIDAAQGNINISAAIGGSGSLTKAGPYVLTLSGVNTYGGPTVISAGTLRLAAAAPAASYTFANVSGTTVVNDGTGGAAMNGTLNANGGSGSISTSGGPIAGLGALVLNGTGTTVDVNSGVTDLGGSGTWTVSAWIKTTQAGATIFNKGDGTNWNSGYSTFYLGTGSNGGSGSLPDAVRWGGGWVAGSTAVNNGSWHQVTYTDAAGTKAVYVDGVLSSLSQNQFVNADTGSKIRIGFAPAGETDGEVATNGSLSGIKIFSSALSASQVAQLYSGGPITSVLPTATDVSIAAGATLDLNGVSQTIGSLSGPGGSAIKLGSGGQLAVSSSASTSFAGNVSGTGQAGLTKSGTGTLTLSGANTYTGPTTISGGTLQLSSPTTVTAATPIASYSFSHLLGNTVINDGSGGAGMNGTLNPNGGTGFISTTGGPAAGMGALVLKGNGTTVDINSGITDLSSSANWTVSAWIKTTQSGATILDKGNGSGWNSGYSTFYLGNGNNSGSGGIPDAVRWGGGWVAGTTSVTDGAWHLVTYTDAGGVKNIYVDGIADALDQNQFLNTDTGSVVRIGFAPTTVDGEVPTSGSLSGINFYNTALSAAQVAGLYTAVTGGSPLPTTTPVNITASGAALNLNGQTQSIGSLAGVAGSSVQLGSGALIVGGVNASTTFAGSISGTGGVLQQNGPGTLALSGANTYSGGTIVNAGLLLIEPAGSSTTSALATGPVTITGGELKLATGTSGGNGPAPTSPIDVTSLSITGSGQFDLNNNHIIITYGATDPFSTIAGYIKSGYNGGGWNGPGVISTAAQTKTNGLSYGVGYADGADGKVSGLSSGQIEVAYTLLGDANLDGLVNAADFTILAANFNQPVTGWDQGDFNYDGLVNAADFTDLAANFNQSVSGAAVSGGDVAALDAYAAANGISLAYVPEPASAGVIAMAGLGVLRRRRRR